MKILKIDLPDSFYDEEPRELIVNRKTKRLWGVLLDLLCEFDRVCKENDISYFIDSGTLLGAVRHKGFIPWDNDLDVIMMREEYVKLCAIGTKKFSAPYFFQTNETDPGSARGHAQLRNSETTAILKSEIRNKKPLYTFNQGVFLDVFVFDSVPDDPDELAEFRMRLNTMKRRIAKLKYAMYGSMSVSWKEAGFIGAILKIKGLMYRGIKKIANVDVLASAYREFEEYVQKYNTKRTKRVANFSLNPCRPDRQLFDKQLYAERVMYMFEGFQFPGPKNAYEVLVGHYCNWREHVIGGEAHGGMFVDVDKPYTEYTRR